jgi:hypothetical protein
LASIIPRKPVRLTKPEFRYEALVSAILLAILASWIAHYGLTRGYFVAIAFAIIILAELFPFRKTFKKSWVNAVPFILGGGSIAVIIALSPRALTQIFFGVSYVIWRSWRSLSPGREQSFSEILILLGFVFEAIFLAAAVWRTPAWICLIVLYATSYLLVYQGLHARGDRLARVLAATWSLIVVEVSWVFLTWLVTYVLGGTFLIVPQAALILTGLAYCFGGIYLSQRQQALTRGRLAEYLLIALLLVIIVASSTPWRGTL